jgi:DNA helicase INO80
MDAEDAAQELERSLFEDSAIPPDDSISATLSKRKNKGKAKESIKRLMPTGDSTSESDLEIPARNESGTPAYKKRKIDQDAASIADDIERSLVVDTPSISLTLKVGGLKGKSKGKQIREASLDSVSATPKHTRKKPSVRKKLGLAPELEAEIGSRPPSVAGDVTPSISRPVSPAPTISSIVYELDEPIPPLRKAKKVDDASMMKRLKSLEEAQRKVWTNIARRDVAKVSYPSVP